MQPATSLPGPEKISHRSAQFAEPLQNILGPCPLVATVYDETLRYRCWPDASAFILKYTAYFCRIIYNGSADICDEALRSSCDWCVLLVSLMKKLQIKVIVFTDFFVRGAPFSQIRLLFSAPIPPNVSNTQRGLTVAHADVHIIPYAWYVLASPRPWGCLYILGLPYSSEHSQNIHLI